MHERRAEQCEAVSLVDVVLNDFVVEDDDTHQPGVQPEPRRDPGGTEIRFIRLCVGIEAEGNDLADVNPQ